MVSTGFEASPAASLLRPFVIFFQRQAASGIVLLAAAVAALAWANSPFSESYFNLWATIVAVSIGEFNISKPLLLWVNDGLMAVFFFVVGLEIKREVLTGELADARKAALSVSAALGGMLFPAGIYTLFNLGGPGARGWGVPMATDIAFALGVLALLGQRVPLALKVFLTAIAIADDLGAVLVIALFYTEKLALIVLLLGLVFLLLQVLLNRLGVRHPLPYAIVGMGLWVAFLKSGVHATIAGVLAAFTIPATRLIDATQFQRRAEVLLAEFAEDLRPGRTEPTADQRDALHSLAVASEALESPLQRLEHMLHPWVAFFVMPVFALANAGIALGAEGGIAFTSPVTIGTIVGLIVGKQVGVFLFSWLAVRLGIAALPNGVTWRQIWGVSLLCGIGFTMSLFIAGLAFPDPAMLDSAKIGILGGSLLAGLAGAGVLVWTSRGAGESPPGASPARSA